MGMSISSRTDGGIAILEVHGNITLGPSSRGLQARARLVLNEPDAGLVLNLAACRAWTARASVDLSPSIRARRAAGSGWCWSGQATA